MLDASFLYLESPSTLMNIGSVQRFALPDTPEKFYRRLRATLERRVPDIQFMSHKLKATPFGLDHPVWVFDQTFRIDNHLERIKLTGKGSRRQLERRISQCHEEVLPRERPLWKYYLIEGLPDNQVVLFAKYHHACFDGVSGQQVMELLFTDTADGKLPLSAQAPGLGAEAEPDASELLLDAAARLARQPLQSARLLPAGIRALGRLTREVWRDSSLRNSGAPATPLNTAISPYRNWTCTSLPLPEVRALAKALGCSLNDLFLAICAGGLRRYLQRSGELPEKPLMCGVPVSVRKPGDQSMNNSVSMLMASLATDVSNPTDRIAAIAGSMRGAKRLLTNTSALTPDDMHLPGIGGALGLITEAGRLARVANLTQPPVNLVISNVPGPRQKRFLCGAEMLTHYPVSIPADNMALNITCQSYIDRLDFGFTACLEVVPNLTRLRDDTVAAWSELRALGIEEGILPLDTANKLTPGSERQIA